MNVLIAWPFFNNIILIKPFCRLHDTPLSSLESELAFVNCARPLDRSYPFDFLAYQPVIIFWFRSSLNENRVQDLYNLIYICFIVYKKNIFLNYLLFIVTCIFPAYYHSIILYHEFYYYNILQHIKKKKNFCCRLFAIHKESHLNIHCQTCNKTIV